MIPSIAQCRALMDQYRMLDNIRAHSFMVAKVAALIADGLRHAGLAIDLDQIIAGALLHDIGKTPCLDDGQNHALVGRDICLRHGYPELAEIVAEHVVLRGELTAKGASAKEIVNYADKRVRHDQVVSLDERLEYILERYGGNDSRLQALIQENFVRVRCLEQRLFGQLDFEPQEMGARLAASAALAFPVMPLERCG